MYHKYRWWAVIALGLSLFIVTIDMTIVSIALPVIAHGFHLSDSMASAINLSYTIPMTLALLPVGLVLHRWHPLTTFLISVLGFGLGSLTCGLSSTFGIVAGRTHYPGHLRGAGLFFGPNRTLLMSTGTRETMGTASALANVGQNIGLVCGPLIVGIIWSRLTNPDTRMVSGMLALIIFCTLAILLTWLASRTTPAMTDITAETPVSAELPTEVSAK